ncbi:MAG: sarcosine oxidase subunit alpha family protein [Geminicoccaceae bacterium]|nr:sarcosine oxidase subunit alpha family protein [Geminicoccaceae bacterium]
MSQSCRTPEGGRVDRAKPIRFTFDGKSYQGCVGDTLASALLANGVHLVGRSFKYHRPRGIVAAGSEEPNALVQVEMGGGRSDPNTRATVVELFDGLNAESQNRNPSLERDVGAVNDALSPLFPAGFYYKTFKWPASAWHKVYEPRIREAAGLGKAPTEGDPDRYLHRHVHCEVLVVGAGPAGLAAALAAGRSGARVILVDENPELGGSLLMESGTLGRVEPGNLAFARRAAADLAAMPEVRVLTRTTLTGYYDYNYLTALERVTDHLPPGSGPDLPRQRLWRIRARRVVIATGAIERPLVFVGNDRPGVMLASAGRAYLNRWGVLPGRDVLVFTNNDSAYAAAIDLARAGAKVTLADVRPHAGALASEAEAAGVALRPRTVVVDTDGRLRVQRAYLSEIDGEGRIVGALGQPLPCDCLLMSGGWNPNVSLHSQARGLLVFDDSLAAFVPGEAPQPNVSVGACNGDLSFKGALEGGAEAGRLAAGAEAKPGEAFGANEPEAAPLLPLWLVPSDREGLRAKAFVDFQNDVTAKDLGVALTEGLRSIEHIKRFTTTGMGTDQGKTSNVNALAIVAAKLNTSVPAVGTTTFRQPYVPATFGAMVGHSKGPLFDVVRKTPIHDWAEAEGAVFEDVGTWKRAWYFPKAGEDMHAAVRRECKAVRETCGLFDASTLGKIDVQGPDARAFLNRIYTNAWMKLPVGQCRYGLMLRDDGMVMDDGVTACLKDDRFHMTTTTGGAPRVLAWLEEWLQTEWPDLKVYCTSVTEEWATMALNGPNAREVLAPLVEGIDMDADAFPHMHWRSGKVAGVPARIFRISFTGETGFEVNVPAGYGRHVWGAIWASGQKHGIVAYGTETMHVLRAEKGYVIVGQDTDGTVTPHDLGMSWIVKKQGDFVGRRGLERPDLKRDDRKQLVGLLTEDPDLVLDEGAQIVADPSEPVPMTMIGHVTSSYDSPDLGRSFALALVAGGKTRKGQTLHVPQLDGSVAAVSVVDPVFLDPEGKRLHG